MKMNRIQIGKASIVMVVLGQNPDPLEAIDVHGSRRSRLGGMFKLLYNL